MTLAAIVIAFLLDQIRSAGPDHAAARLSRRWMRTVAGYMDAGERRHAWLTCVLMIVVPALAAGVIGWLCGRGAGWLGQLAWSVAVLYFTLGFRQFSYHYTAIRDALAAGEEDKARDLLTQWQEAETGPADPPPRGVAARETIAREVIVRAVLSAHHCVFGVLFWFCLFAPLGLAPVGAVLYRHAEFAVQHWRCKDGRGDYAVSPALLVAARTTWRIIDWLPARVTALAFAVVGNFEDAMDAWRHPAVSEGEGADGDAFVLAAAAGALGIRLCDGAENGMGNGAKNGETDVAGDETASARFSNPAPDPAVAGDAAAGDGSAAVHPIQPPRPPDWAPDEPRADGASDGGAGAFSGADPDVRHFAQVAGLLWRSVALWLLMLVLLTLAHVLG